MNSKYWLLTQIPKYKLFKAIGSPKILPLNLTVSVTYRCNSRCKTCNVWKKKVDEFSLDEFDRTFKNIGMQPYWFTLSGGEPFLRTDIVDICNSIYNNCRPGIINIPTNGILYQRIPGMVEEIIKSCPDAQIIINISLDGVGEKHDEIRNVKGNFDKTMRTYEALRSLDYPNFNLGIHTVISNFNVSNIPEIYDYVESLKPDSYITEIAEERVELDTVNSGVTPSLEDYEKSINFLNSKIKNNGYKGISKITQFFREEYYKMVKRVLAEKKQVIPCYAGFASAHIAPDGDVWTCCIRAEPIGNLRDSNYNFAEIWHSDRASELRDSIKNKICFCPLANVSYTNMFHNVNVLSKIALKAIT